MISSLVSFHPFLPSCLTACAIFVLPAFPMDSVDDYLNSGMTKILHPYDNFALGRLVQALHLYSQLCIHSLQERHMDIFCDMFGPSFKENFVENLLSLPREKFKELDEFHDKGARPLLKRTLSRLDLENVAVMVQPSKSLWKDLHFVESEWKLSPLGYVSPGFTSLFGWGMEMMEKESWSSLSFVHPNDIFDTFMEFMMQKTRAFFRKWDEDNPFFVTAHPLRIKTADHKFITCRTLLTSIRGPLERDAFFIAQLFPQAVEDDDQ
eukprot:TRINITY_DN3184_c0_g1_i1.p1 TRINITY_DN3184_c0_g1~~TRINITY_DN3184_c0_g1_i1.p1  ORF type:complete len:265 (-),score=57.51 TRINITY_DN3184_c0_g1_i1:123-917(-)